MMTTMYDVIIVGAGPIGLSCGIEASRKSLSYLIVEKGCLVNSIFNYPTNMTFFSTSEKIEIGDVPFVSHGPKPTRSEALEYYRRVAEKWKLNIHSYEKVQFISPQSDVFEISTTKNVYLSRKVILATGFFDEANPLSIPGEDLPKVQHYFKEAHPYIGQKVVVVGAANSAIDVALECWRKGSDVTLVVRKEEISHRVKYWVRPDIENRIKEGAIKALFNSFLLEIRPKSVLISTPEGVKELENDFVLAMTGYRPDFDWLEQIGIDIRRDEDCLPVLSENYETNIKGLFMAGTICGGLKTSKWFIENAIVHADLVISQIKQSLQSIPDRA